MGAAWFGLFKSFPLIKLAKKLKVGDLEVIELQEIAAFPLIKLAKKLKDQPDGGKSLIFKKFPLIKLAKKLKVFLIDKD